MSESTEDKAEVIWSMRSDPPEGWTAEEWEVYVDGLVKQTREAERQAKTDGTFVKKMHYGNSPWGDDDD